VLRKGLLELCWQGMCNGARGCRGGIGGFVSAAPEGLVSVAPAAEIFPDQDPGFLHCFLETSASTCTCTRVLYCVHSSMLDMNHIFRYME
jgi:hypothetical protein